MQTFRKGYAARIAVGWMLVAAGLSVSAGVIEGESDAHGVATSLDLELLPVLGGLNVTADVGPIAPVQGTAPAAYDTSDSVVSVDTQAGVIVDNLPGVDDGVLLDLGTGLIETNAASTVSGALGPQSASATSTIDGLATSIVSTPLLVNDVINITATTIEAVSTVSGDFGSLVETGTLFVEDLVISVQGAVVATLDGFIAPNTGIDISALGIGASLILNEQIVTGDGISSRGITTNAIHLSFTDVGVAGVGTLNGDVVIGHTAAAAVATPEPSSLLLTSGLAGVVLAGRGWRRRRQRRATVGT